MDTISLENVSYQYSKTFFRVENVSLKLEKSQTTVITGHNGSGKTTLAKLIMGILLPEQGKVCYGNKDAIKMRLFERAIHIGYCFQEPDKQLFCATALEEVMFSLRLRGLNEDQAEENARELLQRFSLLEKTDAFPLKMSAGEKRRLALAAIFAIQPDYYILDEPTIGIDAENKGKLIEYLTEIKQKGAGLIIITHDSRLIKTLADRIITMEKGQTDESA